MRDTHINKQDLINDLKEEIRKLQDECVRYYRIYKETVEDKNKLFEKNNKAKEIIKECIYVMEFHDCEYTDTYKKAEAFLNKE